MLGQTGLTYMRPHNLFPYVLQLSVGNQAIVYQLTVDTQPPSVESIIRWTNRLPPLMEPNAASNIPNAYVATLALWMNFTKPIRPLNEASNNTQILM